MISLIFFLLLMSLWLQFQLATDIRDNIAERFNALERRLFNGKTIEEEKEGK